MSKHRLSTRRRDALRLALTGVCATALLGPWVLRAWAPAQPAPARVPVALAARPADPVLPIIGAGAVGPARAVGIPVRLRIPALHVDAALQRLTRLPDGTLSAPTRWDEPGWYAGGPRPGQLGPAVIAGHVDSVSGPAVFFGLVALRPGDLVEVTARGGQVWRFVVAGSVRVPKDRFPTALVYGPQPVPVLRLITCTGSFDAAQHSYRDNLVVTAYLRS